ncbi:rod shape-determining protein MreD [Pseudooceanicola sp. 502str34]|uniref:rod shape-determining protein MreD n=1 Tax=Maritimibacter alkaliphilus TaxID=404236 RepID=UPI001C973CBC|nr:rod shape-determining protein MreD [Maritimibacter alkaliphilus]MBY6088996.1 rod shape-determining protein MreD [Maritimibacter alkaliphilus]
MAEVTITPASRLWVMRGVFVLLALVVMLFNLMPLETLPRKWAGPDLILVLCIGFTLRRPDYAPPVLVGLVVFMADLLFQRPPGLMAAVTVLACEYLKYRARGLRELPFPVEWLAAGLGVVLVLGGFRLSLSLFLIDTPPLTMTAIRALATILAYPVVVLLLQALLGLRKQGPGDTDSLEFR